MFDQGATAYNIIVHCSTADGASFPSVSSLVSSVLHSHERPIIISDI